MMKTRIWLALGMILALATLSCSGGPKVDPLLRMSAAEALAKGKQLMASKKFRRAAPYFSHAFEVEPNSANGRAGLLLSADALYMAGGDPSYIKAEAKYRDYQNRFPTSDRAPYVQYQIANCLSKRMEKPDRDQTTARKALSAYEQLEQLFPDSEYASEAREQIRLVKDNLAEHEFMVAHFYLRYGLPKASVARLEYLMHHYPGYSHMDKVLYFLGLAYKRNKEPKRAQAAFNKLRAEYPKSHFISDLPKQEDEKG